MLPADVCITALIPTYRRAALLHRAVRSVLAQPHRNLRVVVCDNASEDATPEVMADLMRQDARVVYFRHNTGRVTRLEATNKLLERSGAFNGMKTGYTFAAGRCLVSSGRLNGREVILVQLGSRTKHIFDDAERIMAWSGRGYYGGTSYGTF